MERGLERERERERESERGGRRGTRRSVGKRRERESERARVHVCVCVRGKSYGAKENVLRSDIGQSVKRLYHIILKQYRST